MRDIVGVLRANYDLPDYPPILRQGDKSVFPDDEFQFTFEWARSGPTGTANRKGMYDTPGRCVTPAVGTR